MLSDLFDWIYKNVTANEMAAAGLIMVVSGSLMVYCRSVPLKLWGLVKRRSLIHIELLDRDPSYRWVSGWLSQSDHLIRRTRLLSVETRDGNEGVNNCNVPVHAAQSPMPKDRVVALVPAPGRHIVRYGGHWLLFTRERTDNPKGGSGMSFDFRESWTIVGLRRSRKAILNLINEARELAEPKERTVVRVFNARSNYWDECGCVSTRSIESVPLPGQLQNELLGDLKAFLGRREWYEHRGIPWRRGYLLSGVPGSGKTSLIRAMASELGMGLAVLRLGDDSIDDAGLASLMNSSTAGTNNIVVIEDIDSLWCEREKKEAGKNVTFSGLLNAIDGAGSADGRVMIITTNRPDVLDSALIRAGRVDRRVDFGPATIEQASALYRRWFPDASREAVSRFAAKSVQPKSDELGNGISPSMADVQALLIECSKDDLNPFEGDREAA